MNPNPASRPWSVDPQPQICLIMEFEIRDTVKTQEQLKTLLGWISTWERLAEWHPIQIANQTARTDEETQPWWTYAVSSNDGWKQIWKLYHTPDIEPQVGLVAPSSNTNMVILSPLSN